MPKHLTDCWSACLDKEVTVKHVSPLLILTRYENCVLNPLNRTYSYNTQDGILELHFSRVFIAHDTSGKRLRATESATKTFAERDYDELTGFVSTSLNT